MHASGAGHRTPRAGKDEALGDTAPDIRDALNGGRNAEALDLARQAMLADPRSAELAYLGALASARMGATGEAERWLGPNLGYEPARNPG